MKKFFIQSNNKGFAMLFTVLIVSIMLAIGLSIADVTYKQQLLSNLAQSSQLAFYQADAGVECGLYYDTTIAMDPTKPLSSIQCGNNTLTLDTTQAVAQYAVYISNVNAMGPTPCYSVTIDKTDAVKTSISSTGYSTCTSTPQQVERGLNVTY